MNKNRKKIIFYLCLIFVFSLGILQAQTNFRAGYIIDLKNDTLTGEIDYRGDILMGEICVFKAQNGKITKFEPQEIVGYRFKDDRYFIAKRINNKPIFLEFLIKGKINVYYYRNKSSDHYLIEKEGGKLVELPYKERIVYKDDTTSVTKNTKRYMYNSSQHIGILIYNMQDAPKLLEKIKNFKEPNHDNLIELAKDYHNTVCTTEACIVYQRKKTEVKVKIEPLLGILNYTKADKSVDKFSLTGGVLAHIWLPRVNEKLYLRTGVLYANTKVENVGQINLFKMPLQIEYVYPKGQFLPKFAYGFNIFKPFYVTVGTMVGFDAKINEKMAFGLNYDLDFDSFEYLPFLPKSLLIQTISLGFSLKL
jgi:hypothetical protein